MCRTSKSEIGDENLSGSAHCTYPISLSAFSSSYSRLRHWLELRLGKPADITLYFGLLAGEMCKAFEAGSLGVPVSTSSTSVYR
jgi:hypothetical protein